MRYKITVGRDYLDSRRMFYEVRRNDKENFISYISFLIQDGVARDFELIDWEHSFQSKIFTGKMILRAIHDCFTKYNLESVEFVAVQGSEGDTLYCKQIHKFSGEVIGSYKDSDGDFMRCFRIDRDRYLESSYCSLVQLF